MTTPHPLSEARAAKIWESQAENLTPALVNLLQAAYDAGKAGATTDDGWEPLDWDENPARPDDEVECTITVGGVSTVRRGVIRDVRMNGSVWARAGLIGKKGCGTWRVRRKPAEEVELPTEFGDVITDVEADFGETVQFDRMVWTGWRWTYRDHSTTAEFITAFTLPDGARARRDGEREDGTPRFVKVQEGEK